MNTNEQEAVNRTAIRESLEQLDKLYQEYCQEHQVNQGSAVGRRAARLAVSQIALDRGLVHWENGKLVAGGSYDEEKVRRLLDF